MMIFIAIILILIFLFVLIISNVPRKKKRKNIKNTKIRQVKRKEMLNSKEDTPEGRTERTAEAFGVDEDGQIKCPRCDGFKRGKKPQYRYKKISGGYQLKCRKCGNIT